MVPKQLKPEYLTPVINRPTMKNFRHPGIKTSLHTSRTPCFITGRKYVASIKSISNDLSLAIWYLLRLLKKLSVLLREESYPYY